MATNQTPATAAALKADIERLRAQIASLQALTADRQTQFRAAFDRDGAEQLLAELLRMTADMMSAREMVAQLESELTALRRSRLSRPWWWRMLGG
jgi:hypothetical protein